MRTDAHANSRRRDTVLLAAGVLFFAVFYNLPPADLGILQLDILKLSAATFRGDFLKVDIIADIIGFRGLYFGTDPYPILGPAFEGLGVNWDVDFPNTHPPTAYLFAAPIAFLPMKTAVAVWAFACLGGILASYLLLGWPWRRAAGLALLTLLWPPAAFSTGQLTVIWLLGFAFAYRMADRHGGWGGAAIAAASMTKLFPAALLIPLLISRNIRAVLAFALVWIAALSLVTLMNPDALFRFVEVNVGNVVLQVNKPSNASLMAVGYRTLGLYGVALAMGFLLSVLLVVVRGARRDGGMDRRTVWMLSLYFSVALAPIVWIYSFLPLLPVIWYFLRTDSRIGTIAAIYAIVLPMLWPPYGLEAGLLLPTIFVVFGLAFMALAWQPSRYRRGLRSLYSPQKIAAR